MNLILYIPGIALATTTKNTKIDYMCYWIKKNLDDASEDE